MAFYVPRIGPLLVRETVTPAGGAETQVLLLARALASRGLKVTFVVFEMNGVVIPQVFDGVRVSLRPPYRARQRLGSLREAMSIGKALAKVDAEVVVTRMSSPEVGVAAVFAKLLGRRFVYSSASVSDFMADTGAANAENSEFSPRQPDADARTVELDFSRLGRTSREWRLFRLGVRLADRIVVQTEEQVRLCQVHFGRSPMLIRSIAEREPERQGEPEAFLWIGRVVPSKRPDAFVELASRLPRAKFWMVAVPASDHADDVESMAALERSAADVENLELLPARPRDELLSLVDRAVAVVSTSDFEGMPNTFLEGWARGVPALAFTHDPDGVIEGHGLGFCARGSSETLTDLSVRMWETRKDQTDIAARCRNYVVQHHSPEVVSARWQDVLYSG